MRTGGTIQDFDVTPGGRARKCGPKGSKIRFVMLHIKSKVMKKRIQWFKTCPKGMSGGHQRSSSRILGPFLAHLSKAQDELL